jgi:hypothetical protein
VVEYKMTRNKLNAVKTKIDNYTFDSKLEARRYQQLKLLEKAGEIDLLEVHPRYLLIHGFKTKWGETIRPMYYEADFQYWDRKACRTVTEDAKGFQTAVSKIKIKLFKWIYWQYEFKLVRKKE